MLFLEVRGFLEVYALKGDIVCALNKSLSWGEQAHANYLW